MLYPLISTSEFPVLFKLLSSLLSLLKQNNPFEILLTSSTDNWCFHRGENLRTHLVTTTKNLSKTNWAFYCLSLDRAQNTRQTILIKLLVKASIMMITKQQNAAILFLLVAVWTAIKWNLMRNYVSIKCGVIWGWQVFNIGKLEGEREKIEKEKTKSITNGEKTFWNFLSTRRRRKKNGNEKRWDSWIFF